MIHGEYIVNDVTCSMEMLHFMLRARGECVMFSSKGEIMVNSSASARRCLVYLFWFTYFSSPVFSDVSLLFCHSQASIPRTKVYFSLLADRCVRERRIKNNAEGDAALRGPACAIARKIMRLKR